MTCIFLHTLSMVKLGSEQRKTIAGWLDDAQATIVSVLSCMSCSSCRFMIVLSCTSLLCTLRHLTPAKSSSSVDNFIQIQIRVF